jgi:3-oxoadipate enol-lactonase
MQDAILGDITAHPRGCLSVDVANEKYQIGAASPTQVVQSYFDAFGRGDIEACVALLDSNVVWHIDGATSVSTVGLLRGRNRVRDWLLSFPQNFIPRVFTISRLIEDGNDVLAIGRFRHTITNTGRAAGSDLVIRFTVQDSLIKRYQIFEDSYVLARAFDPAEEWREHTVRLNSVPYAYADTGEGPVMVFAHGLFVDRTMFASQIAAFQSTHRCVAFDMPAHSGSGYRLEGWTLEDIAEDFALMIEEMSLGPVTFVGQSQGGMVGMRLALKRPDLLSKLVLIGTSARTEYAERLDNWRTIQHTLMHGTEMECEAAFTALQRHVNNETWLDGHPEIAASRRKIMLSHDRKGLAKAIDAAVLKRDDIRSALPGIQTPTLVVYGEADRATPPEVNQEIGQLVNGARTVMQPGIGHHSPIEAPANIIEVLREFLS